MTAAPTFPATPNRPDDAPCRGPLKGADTGGTPGPIRDGRSPENKPLRRAAAFVLLAGVFVAGPAAVASAVDTSTVGAAVSGLQAVPGAVEGCCAAPIAAPSTGQGMPVFGSVEGGKPRRLGTPLERWEAESIEARRAADELARQKAEAAGKPKSNSRTKGTG